MVNAARDRPGNRCPPEDLARVCVRTPGRAIHRRLIHDTQDRSPPIIRECEQPGTGCVLCQSRYGSRWSGSVGKTRRSQCEDTGRVKTPRRRGSARMRRMSERNLDAFRPRTSCRSREGKAAECRRWGECWPGRSVDPNRAVSGGKVPIRNEAVRRSEGEHRLMNIQDSTIVDAMIRCVLYSTETVGKAF